MREGKGRAESDVKMRERVKEGRRKTYADTKISQMVSALTDSQAKPEVKQDFVPL